MEQAGKERSCEWKEGVANSVAASDALAFLAGRFRGAN
jgi:hypothetical protein